ncbi:MAG: nucleotide exchange factor GrpE [Agarilytica sp.]
MENNVSNEQTPENTASETLEDDQVTLDSVKEPSEDSQQDLSAEIEKLQDEIAQAKEQVLRAAAETQNIRRRAEQDVEKAHKFALEKFVNDMLPVADNLERALDATKADGADLNTVVEGVSLTLKTLVDGLARHKVETVEPEGEPFNPELHQAMQMVPNPDVEPNTVINVFQKGYTLNGRLVRPAMVVVSKAAE